MKRLFALMAGLSSRASAAPRQADQSPVRAEPVAPDCAIWHDVVRALDAKPKGPAK